MLCTPKQALRNFVHNELGVHVGLTSVALGPSCVILLASWQINSLLWHPESTCLVSAEILSGCGYTSYKFHGVKSYFMHSVTM